MTDYTSLYEPAAVHDPSVALEKAFDGQDGIMFAHIGHFTWNFGIVEMGLTLLLWIFTGRQDVRTFELLVKGMDAKVKVERLRKAIKLHGSAIGPNLKARLAHFESAQINLRNQLAHSDVSLHDGAFHFGTIAALAHMLGSEHGAAKTISTAQLFERAAWLNLFCQDLMELIGRMPNPLPTQPLATEIDHPKSGVPTATTGNPAQ
jgi:hypothetical protein